jgi:hypothetical protein
MQVMGKRNIYSTGFEHSGKGLLMCGYHIYYNFYGGHNTNVVVYFFGS